MQKKQPQQPQQKWHYRRSYSTKKRNRALPVLLCCAGICALCVIGVFLLPGLLSSNNVSQGESISSSTVEPSVSQPVTSEPPVDIAPTTAPTSQQTVDDVTEDPITEQEKQELDSLLESMPGRVSVWLKDITTGQTYTYQTQTDYYCASVLKAPYALWLSQKDESGEIDLSEMHYSKSYWDLLHNMIANSDNDATYLIANKWQADAQSGFQDFLSQLGFSNPGSCDVMPDGIHGRMTAEDGGKTMEALYNYFETGTEDAKRLQDAFLAADHQLLWLPDTAAKKYGSWDGALHDMAIVYTEHPYIISVFTDWGNTEVGFPAEGTARMQQIGQLAADVMLN